ncbi:major histocompatibility complex class I-related gene protein-like isoform X2 [Sceloporus undulatus]|uniref:major histocompatibility complex class I-related gene protein-like isoform X2 n=1 Tax=Sceloporus undulatus TaxID=8520 RepID=UPI001C4BD692|nr:major histocompatibility complex class I-related gene protein-like isoform X2 [Sceloporus undulatus]
MAPLVLLLASSSSLLLLLLGSSLGVSSHFYRITYMGVSQPNQELPQFIAVGYADDQPIARYDSGTEKIVPQVPWMKKAVEEDPKYYNWYTQILQHDEYNFRGDLVTLRNRYNQSEGFHTVQMMIVCEVRDDGSKGGHWRYGYDGRDFLSFDMETLAWMAPDMQAQVIKRMWEKGGKLVRRFKAFLEETCAEWMQKDLDYGKERLLRKETPTVKVMRKPEYDSMETLICQAYGFYPQEIDITWTKDDEVWVQDTFHGVLAPNSDGTYRTWLGIKIDPKERDHYRCRVEHDGLLEPLELAWKEPERHQDGYRAASST